MHQRIETAPAARLWIAWQHHQRNRSMSAALGAELDEMIATRPGRVARYRELAARTVARIRAFPGRDVFVMNPSIVLAAVAVAACRLTGKRLVIDAHSAGLEPLEGRRPALNRLARLVTRAAHAVIVTNQGSAALARAMGGRPVVMPDPVPALPAAADAPPPQLRAGVPNILFICVWDPDEPYREVIEAARAVPDAHVIITGRYARRGIDPAAMPENVTLAGFVDEAVYHALLRGADLAMDLTTRNNCMVCGAYEMVAAGTPGILSDWPVNRGYFDQGFVFAANSAAGIAEAMRRALAELPALRAGIARLATDLAARDRDHAAAVDAALSGS